MSKHEEHNEKAKNIIDKGLKRFAAILKEDSHRRWVRYYDEMILGNELDLYPTIYLKTIIEPQEGTVELTKEEPDKFVLVFRNTHIFSHEQTGYGYSSLDKTIIEVKYKKLEIMGYVSDREYPCWYTFDDGGEPFFDKRADHHFMEFDPDKTFLRQYVTQELNKKIRELTQEIVNLNGEEYD